MRIALHTRVRAAGVSEWTIRRSGAELFHLLEVERYAAMIAELDGLPVDFAWRTRTAELLDVVHDYSARGSGTSPTVVWQL